MGIGASISFLYHIDSFWKFANSLSRSVDNRNMGVSNGVSAIMYIVLWSRLDIHGSGSKTQQVTSSATLLATRSAFADELS